MVSGTPPKVVDLRNIVQKIVDNQNVAILGVGALSKRSERWGSAGASSIQSHKRPSAVVGNRLRGHLGGAPEPRSPGCLYRVLRPDTQFEQANWTHPPIRAEKSAATLSCSKGV
jgi:hypothetical protein